MADPFFMLATPDRYQPITAPLTRFDCESFRSTNLTLLKNRVAKSLTFTRKKIIINFPLAHKLQARCFKNPKKTT